MLSFLLLRETKTTRPTYYRVAVEYNLFGEYSVMREWGPSGRPGAQMLHWFSNLREACLAAEHSRKRALRRGYIAQNRVTEVVGP